MPFVPHRTKIMRSTKIANFVVDRRENDRVNPKR